MDIRLLGPLEVVDGDRSLALGGVKQRALLALLACAPTKTNRVAGTIARAIAAGEGSVWMGGGASGGLIHTRCWPRAKLANPDVCTTDDPALRPLSPAHGVACHFAEKVAGSPDQESVSRGLDGG